MQHDFLLYLNFRGHFRDNKNWKQIVKTNKKSNNKIIKIIFCGGAFITVGSVGLVVWSPLLGKTNVGTQF